MPAKPFPVQQSDRKLTIVAWVVTVLISVVPDIFWSRLAHAPSIWLNHAKMILLVVLALTALFWKPLRPLQNFFVAMLAFFVLFDLRLHFSFTWPALQNLFGKNAFDIRMQAEQTGKLAVSFGMIAVLLLLGLKRRDLFLVRGDLRTPIEPVRWLGFLRPVSWVSFGLQWSVYISVALVILQYIGNAPQHHSAAQGRAYPAIDSFLCFVERVQRRNRLSHPYARHVGVRHWQQTGSMDLRLLLWHRPLFRRARRHRGQHRFYFHGLDFRQGYSSKRAAYSGRGGFIS